MRTIEIPYGESRQTLRIDETRLAAVLSPEKLSATGRSETEIVKEALQNPVDSPRLAELAKGNNKILVITSDHTRPVPSKITMPLLLSEIRTGNPEAEITILIATGLHRATTEAELRNKFGGEIVESENIVVHDARDEKSLVSFGKLPSGGELWLNRLIKESDLVVAEGFVEPHFFAGFSGGRKSVMPGCAGEKTVLWNHNARFIASDKSRTGKIKENPIHADMLFAAKTAGLAFILNVLLDHDKHIIAAFSGDMETAHEKGCALSRKLCEVPAIKSDIVITSNGGYPLDQNIYQCVKGMTAAEACVNPGGVIIMCAEARDGAGGDSFYHWFADRKSPADVAQDIENTPPEETVPDQWEAQILARIMQKARCIFVTGAKNRKNVEAMHFAYAPDIDTAVSAASKIVGEESKITAIPDGIGVIIKEGQGVDLLSLIKSHDVFIREAFAPTNIAAAREEFMSNPDMRTPRFSYDIDISQIETNLVELSKLREKVKVSVADSEYVEGKLNITIARNQLTSAAYHYNNADSPAEKKKAADVFQKTNTYLYGEPNKTIFDYWYSKRGDYTPFTPWEDTVKQFSRIVCDAFSDFFKHIPNGKEQFTTEEACAIVNKIIREEVGESNTPYRAVMDDEKECCSVNRGKIYFPRRRAAGLFTQNSLKKIIVHELGSHALHGLIHKESDFASLPYRKKISEEYDEGIAKCLECAVDGKYEHSGVKHYINIGLAHFCGWDFRKIYEFDESEDKRLSFSRAMRCFRGTGELTNYKDLAYYTGAETVWRYIERHIDDPRLFDHMFIDFAATSIENVKKKGLYEVNPL